MPRRRLRLARGLKILVAEQSAGMADVLASALKGIGVGTVQKATSIAAAEKHLEAGAFDAVILDFDLGTGGAVQFTLNLRRSSHPAAHTPIIALTSEVDRAKVKSALLAGVNRLLERPVSADSLLLHVVSLRTESARDATPIQEPPDSFLV